MKNYHFCETVCGEEFLVGADTYEEARGIAEDVARDMSETWYTGCWDLEYYGTMSDFWAECSGLDEY